MRSDRRFLSQNRLEDVIQQIVAGTNRYVNESSPIVDARLEDGSRVNVCAETGRIERTDRDDPEVSERGCYDGTTDLMGKSPERGG